MVLVNRFALILMFVVVLPLSLAAQELGSISTLEDQIRQLEAQAQGAGVSQEVRSLNSNFLATRRAQLYALLEKEDQRCQGLPVTDRGYSYCCGKRRRRQFYQALERKTHRT